MGNRTNQANFPKNYSNKCCVKICRDGICCTTIARLLRQRLPDTAMLTAQCLLRPLKSVTELSVVPLLWVLLAVAGVEGACRVRGAVAEAYAPA